MTTMTQRRQAYHQTARDIVAIFFVKKHVFIMTLIGVITGAMALSFLTPPIYEANTQLIVKPYNSKPLVFDQDSSRMNVFSEVTEQTLNTVIFLLTSPEVLREVVLAHKLASPDNEEEILEEIASLKGRVKAEPLTMSSVVKVSLRGRDPQAITAQLNTLIDAYIRHHIRVNQATEGRLQFFDQQTEYFRQQYDKLNEELAKASKRLNIIDPAVQKDTSLMLIKDLEISKSQMLAQIEALRAKVEGFRSAISNFKNNERLAGLPAETLLTYPALVEMEKSLAQLLINRQRTLNDFQPTSKQVQDANQQYGAMKAQIRRSMEQIVRDLETQMDSLKRAIADVDHKIAEVRQRSIDLTGSALEMERLALEHKLTKENYTLYSSKREEARINEEKDRAQFANVTVANRPVLPTSPWFPQRGKIMLLAVPLALLLSLAFTAAAYALEQRLWTQTDLNLHTDLRVLGTFDAVGIVEKPLFSLNLLRTRNASGS